MGRRHRDGMNDTLRITLSLFSLVTAAAVLNALKGAGRPVQLWLAVAAAAGAFFTHVAPGLPAPLLLPAGVIAGALFVSLGTSSDRFATLDDHQWRMLTLTRAVFGSLLLAAGTAGLLPVSFALGAGLGDIASAALALVVPGSLAYGGHRGARLLVFGFGLLDFIGVFLGIATIVVPWLAHTSSPGISLLLPWVAVPMLLTLNVFGFRQAVRELLQAPATA
jgi:hypothetical protein